MRVSFSAMAAFVAACGLGLSADGQEYGKPDRDAPGDRRIQEYLARQTERIEGPWLVGVKNREDWEKLRQEYREEYYYMLGLAPLPEKTPLKAAVTGTLQGDGFVVEKLHYQSRPRLYVTGNLYRPRQVKPGERLPAVFYVCGHSGMGRDGNKTAYQSHGIWFARHGYVCLVVDSLQLGEIAAIHHGTYRENRWWWHSRGYTPAGVECWNGVRGIDYLVSRPDVDPQRIAVTGISGGGAATYWIAAADERVKVAVPVSGMADLRSYVTNRVINGHCDCMFLYNTFQWPWARIAALIAPRPMLFTNSDNDAIFPMDANERVIARLERVYSLYGAGDLVDAFVSIGGHAYRKDIRRAAYRFLNIHLKNDPRIVEDSEVDLVESDKGAKRYPIEPAKLRVFATDADLPKDELNTSIDRHFVPLAKVAPPKAGEFDAWKKRLVDELRRVTFRGFPERIPPARVITMEVPGEWRLETEPGIEVRLTDMANAKMPALTKLADRILLQVKGHGPYLLESRGVGHTQWTQKNPPNYVARSHALLGRTVDSGRVWDVIAAARYLRAKHAAPVHVGGDGPLAVLAAYAALLEPEIEGAMLSKPPLSHMEPGAPPLLNVLRVCDVPEVLGMLAPRPLTLFGVSRESLGTVIQAYRAAGADEKLVILSRMR